jgi:hypothetical protein
MRALTLPLNVELKRAAKPPIAIGRVIDTLVLARREHACGNNTLDDLVFALPHKFTVQQTWGFARCRAVGRDLCRADHNASSSAAA